MKKIKSIKSLNVWNGNQKSFPTFSLKIWVSSLFNIPLFFFSRICESILHISNLRQICRIYEELINKDPYKSFCQLFLSFWIHLSFKYTPFHRMISKWKYCQKESWKSHSKLDRFKINKRSNFYLFFHQLTIKGKQLRQLLKIYKKHHVWGLNNENLKMITSSSKRMTMMLMIKTKQKGKNCSNWIKNLRR